MKINFFKKSTFLKKILLKSNLKKIFLFKSNTYINFFDKSIFKKSIFRQIYYLNENQFF